MTGFHRVDQPELLRLHGTEIAEEYVRERTSNPRYQFRWPTRDGQFLLDVVRAALAGMTQTHCSYCDGIDLNSVGEEHIDHFRPKTRVEFYSLVCTWENLFFVCSACNKSKLAKWDDLLLRPDDPTFSFSRYFEYRSDSGELRPNAVASTEDQSRASRTIELLKLNRSGACGMRKKLAKRISAGDSADQLAGHGYRYLLDLGSNSPVSAAN